MKLLKTSFLTMFFVFLVVALSSCNKETQVVNTESDLYDTPSFLYVDFNADPSNLVDATESQPMLLDPIDDRGNTNLGPADRMFNPLAKILRELKLTPEQQEQVKILLKARIDCITEAMKILRESEKAIMDRYREKYKALMDEAKANNWTREQIRKALQELNAAVRKALQENPVRAKVLEMIKNCDEEFNQGMLNILDDRQDVIWKKFWENFGKGKGLGSRGIVIGQQEDYESEAYLYAEFNTNPSDIIEANPQQPMALNPPDDRGGNGNNPNLGAENRVLNPLGRILRELKLTPEQQEPVKLLLKARIDCITEAMKLLRESEKAIMEKYRERYKALMDEAKANNWTREQLRKALAEMNAALRKALQENPVRARVLEMIKNCEEQFNQGMLRILDDEQDILWKRFWDNLLKNNSGGVRK